MFMQFRNKKYILVILSVLFFYNSVFAKGNLIARCDKLEEQKLGFDDAGFSVSVPKYKIETGQCYKLPITSSGKHEYILQGAKFFSHIYIRKLDIAQMEIGINSLRSIDFDGPVTAVLYFLAVKPGKYMITDRDLSDKGTRFEIEVE